MKITNPYGPNATVLLAGGCNASCNFCFWDRRSGNIRVSNYLDKVFASLDTLPSNFRVLSISGGEPTLSPFFEEFMIRLAKYRRKRDFDRVVLTTHGGKLQKHLFLIGSSVDHVNISRHAVGYTDNCKVFGTTSIPTDEDLQNIISKIHRVTSADVTLNCVIKPDVSVDFCHKFIKYARSLGADAVSFRKEASTVEPTAAERTFVKRYGVINKTDCPVCRGLVMRVDGFEVRWKGSVNEPSLDTKGVYEVVIHPDGKMYRDWSMSAPVTFRAARTSPSLRSSRPAYSGGGCGSRGVGGC